MKKNQIVAANPQGKGLIPVLDDLRSVTPVLAQGKSAHQLLADFFTSTLVLGAKFNFKPSLGVNYYLYLDNQQWKLSLVEPQAWRDRLPGIYFGECMLNTDQTWSVKPCESWQQNPNLCNELEKLQSAFIASLNNDNSIIDNLPFYQSNLAYYQRLGANALARSIKQSLQLGLGKKQLGSDISKQLLSEAFSANQPLITNRSC